MNPDLIAKVEEFFSDKSDDYKAGYRQGTLESAFGFYSAMKEIHDGSESKDKALNEIALFMTNIGSILLDAGVLKEDDI